MLTRVDILRLEDKPYIRFHRDGECKCIKGKRGGLTLRVTAWRRNGKTKFWKTKPEAFEIPIKKGFGRKSEDYGYLNDLNCHEFHTEDQCDALREYRTLWEIKEQKNVAREQEKLSKRSQSPSL